MPCHKTEPCHRTELHDPIKCPIVKKQKQTNRNKNSGWHLIQFERKSSTYTSEHAASNGPLVLLMKKHDFIPWLGVNVKPPQNQSIMNGQRRHHKQGTSTVYIFTFSQFITLCLVRVVFTVIGQTKWTYNGVLYAPMVKFTWLVCAWKHVILWQCLYVDVKKKEQKTPRQLSLWPNF